MSKTSRKIHAPFVITPIALIVGMLAASTTVMAAQRTRPSEFLTPGEIKQLGQLTEGKRAHPRKGIELQRARQHKDQNGQTHARVKQYYDGLPVWNADMMIHIKANGQSEVTGVMISGLESELPLPLPKQYKISASDAAAIALNLIDIPVKPSTKPRQPARTELGIHIDRSSKARIAYHVNLGAVKTSKGIQSPEMIIDAQTGKLINQWDNAEHAKEGTGPGGNGKTLQYEYGVDLDYLDITRVGNTCSLDTPDYQTRDAQQGTLSTPADVTFACSDTVKRNTLRPYEGGFSALNDIHYFAGATIAIYQEITGTKPYPGKIILNGYADPVANGYGAKTFPTSGEIFFGYGGPNPENPLHNYHPWSSADIVAHEITHLFNAQHSYVGKHGVATGGGAAKALNEAIGDIAGELLEQRIKGSNDWKFGDDISKPGTPPVRSLSNPAINHKSLHSFSNTDHDNAGIFNRAFYLLATTSGWTVKKVFQVTSKANMDGRWTSDVSFEDAACGAMIAANDLKFNVPNVATAFNGVGIVCPTPPVVPNYKAGGYVTSASSPGTALPGMTVTAKGTRGTFTATTDTNGLYILSLPSGSYTLTATKPGYTLGSTSVVINDNTTGTTVISTMSAAATSAVKGQIMDSSLPFGAPGLYLSGRKVEVLQGTTVVATTTTDSAGRYEIPSLQSGVSYTVKITDPGWSATYVEFTMTTLPQTFNMATTANGTGIVAGSVKTSGNVAIPGVQMSLKPCGTTTTYTGATNANGLFKFSFAAPTSSSDPSCPVGKAKVFVLTPNSPNAAGVLVNNGTTNVALTDITPL